MTWRDEDEVSAVVSEIRRRQRVRLRDWAIFFVALALIAAVAAL